MAKIFGVALILVSPDDPNHVFVLKEKQNRPWKTIGDFSIPMETLQPNESHSHAISRALDEEVGIDAVTGILYTIGDYDLVDVALASAYYTELKSISFFRVKNPEEAEVVGFMHYAKLLKETIRPGVREMILSWLSPPLNTKGWIQ
ncbi:MAG: NUDIX hydrolase [bacterium]|nr:NUDIX hydrolase [bacterium]